ncbi:MAG: ureidoglycolate lyase [Paraglaciecola sp.]|jgi:ureidoglycolate lyase
MEIIPLSAELFAAYGDVIEVASTAKHFSINEGHTERYHDLATVEVTKDGGRPLISIFRAEPLAMPHKIKVMERHPLSSQTFMPLGQHPYLVVVAAKGEFIANTIKVFLAQANQGVNYHAGTWHHYCFALQQVSDFLVVDRGGEGQNCDLMELDGSQLVQWP